MYLYYKLKQIWSIFSKPVRQFLCLDDQGSHESLEEYQVIIYNHQMFFSLSVYVICSQTMLLSLNQNFKTLLV